LTDQSSWEILVPVMAEVRLAKPTAAVERVLKSFMFLDVGADDETMLTCTKK
jgi:hypothetical protein